MKLSQTIAIAKQTIQKAKNKFLAAPPNLNVWQWAEWRQWLGKDVTAKPGKYRVDFAPYQKAPQESFTDQTVQTTVLYWASRLGKTQILCNLNGYIIELWPRNILVVYPTLDSAKKWSKQFFTPMVKAIRALRKLVGSDKSRDASNTILAKQYPGGTIAAIGSNSPSGFRQVPAPVIECDEIDAMEDGPEGDPVALAFKRAENFSDTVQVVSSTATKVFNKAPAPGESSEINTGSRIHNWWLKSDQQKWFVPCPKCGQHQVLEWEQVKWPKPHIHEQAFYQCKHCPAQWNDEMRVAAIRAGEWRATAPFRGIRGYWLNGINTVFPPKKGYKSKLHQMAAEWYEAFTSGEMSLLVWKNTFKCEPHEETVEKVDKKPLLERREKYSPDDLPNEIALLGCSVDVQADRLEYEIIGMGESEETWGVTYGKIAGNPDKDEPWEDLKGVLSKSFKRRDGVELKITCTAIDHRHKGDRVRQFVRKCGFPRVYPVYGQGGKQTILVRVVTNKKYRMLLYSVNTDAAKDIIFARLKLEAPGPRYMHFPAGFGYEEETGYFDQLTSEEVRIVYDKGFPKRVYHKPPSARNEALDLRVYFLAAMDILKPSIKHILANLQANKPAQPPKDYILKDPQQPKPEPPKPQPRPRRRMTMGGGFVGGWRK